MDLSRWAPRRLLHLTKSTRSLYDYLADILDGERAVLDDAAARQPDSPFESRQDVENLGARVLPSRGSGQRRLEGVFEALSPFYEAGFHFIFEDGVWKVRALFLYGRHFEPAIAEPAPFEPPSVPEGGVSRGRGAPVVRAFRLDALLKLRDSEAFVFDVRQGSLFLLLSERPRPWVDEHVAKTRQALDAIFRAGAVK